jgi:hypothetical protein
MPRIDYKYPKERVLLDSATMRLRRLLGESGQQKAESRSESFLSHARGIIVAILDFPYLVGRITERRWTMRARRSE